MTDKRLIQFTQLIGHNKKKFVDIFTLESNLCLSSVMAIMYYEVKQSTSHLFGWLLSKSQKRTIGKDMEEKEPLYTISGNIHC